MDFNKTVEQIADVLNNVGSIINPDDYDGVIVKKLEASNTLDSGRTTNQTHIAITGNQMDIFPYLRSDGYFTNNYNEQDKDLKKFFITQIPVFIYMSNVEYLGNVDSESPIIFDGNQSKRTLTSVVRSRRNGAADQIQVSLTNEDSPDFVLFRKLIHAGSYLIILKRREKVEYEAYGIKNDDIVVGNVNLSDMNNKFAKLPTNTKIDVSDFIELPEEHTDKSDDEESLYQIAAKVILDYVSSIGFKFDVPQETISSLYQEFYDKFSPEALAKIPDEKLLKSLFYTAESTNDSLCYWLEFHSQNKKCFGSIAGGSSFKFGLFQKKEDGTWVTGSPNKPEELSDEDAAKLGHEICDYIIKGAKIIEAAGSLSTVEEYEKLDDNLNVAIGKYASFAWIHKYYCMIFPSKLATWHSSDWQKHILYAYGIKPSDKYYGRSGQLSIIANYAKISAPFFAHASYDKFGGIKQFCRIGTSDGTTGKKYFSDWKKRKIVSIGWNDTESLANYIVGDDINKKVITEKLSEVYYPTDARIASRKAGELASFYRTSENTIFVAADGESLLALGDGVGAYYYDSSNSFAHCKPITWHCCFIDENKLPNKTEGLMTSCYLLSDSDNLLYLYHKYYYDMDEIEVDEVMGKKEIIKRAPRTDLIHPLNQIIYGAPGTGKTYSSAEYALAIIEKREINYSKRTPEERKALMEKYETYVENGQITFTTFHQSYGYEEFIQGIRPDSTSGTVNFKKADGIFKKLADKALPDTENNYVIIIDEINRGNISKVFGELITLIEEDKRYGELNQLSITLPLGDKFTVPNNLYIIGTMNSADKSISLIDTALRRRFAFVEMAPDESIVEDSTLRKALTSINAYLKKELRSTDLLVGHSFFVGKPPEALGDIMNRNIIPLLYEYFYDDEAKVKKALECLDGTDYVIDSEYRGRIRVQKKV